MLANFVKARITAVILAAIATAPLLAPAELGVLATEEEIAVSEAAGVGEGASLEEVGEGIGESVGEIGAGGEGGGSLPPGTEPPGTPGEPPETPGDPPETPGDPPGTGGDPPGTGGETPNNNGVGPPGSPGGGTNEGTGSTKDGKKRVPGVKMPWDTKPSYTKNGNPKTRGWHRVAEGKTSVLANFLTPYAATVSQHHYIWIRGMHY